MDQERWQKITGVPLTIAAVTFLVAYAWEVLGNLSGAAGNAAEFIITATWIVFVLDYAVNLVLAPQRWRWFRTHIFDLLVVVLPLLRPLRCSGWSPCSAFCREQPARRSASAW